MDRPIRCSSLMLEREEHQAFILDNIQYLEFLAKFYEICQYLFLFGNHPRNRRSQILTAFFIFLIVFIICVVILQDQCLLQTIITASL
jgi:hypothetical protein